MASKTLPICAESPRTQAGRMSVLEPRMSGEAQLSAMAPLKPNIASPRKDSRLRHLQTDLLGSENYQVALVPTAKSAPRFRVGASDTAPPILLLPLTWKELIARVRAEADYERSLQRAVVLFGTVRVDLFRIEVRRSDRPVVLTALEFKLLRFFVTSPGRVISRDELLNQVLRLRKKLEPDPAHPVHFQTVYGVGYKFVSKPIGQQLRNEHEAA